MMNEKRSKIAIFSIGLYFNFLTALCVLNNKPFFTFIDYRKDVQFAYHIHFYYHHNVYNPHSPAKLKSIIKWLNSRDISIDYQDSLLHNHSMTKNDRSLLAFYSSNMIATASITRLDHEDMLYFYEPYCNYHIVACVIECNHCLLESNVLNNIEY